MLNTKPRPRILALVGMPGAGKSSCAKYLEDQGYYQYRFGSIVVNEVIRRDLPVTPDNERLVREEIRANEGMDAMAQRALPHLRQALLQNQCIVIDGLYSWSEYKTLRAEFGDEMVVVNVYSPRHLRYQRLASRPVRPLTPEQAEQRDYQEIETLEKGGPIAIADFTLINETTQEVLIESLENLLTQLTFQP